VVLAVQVDQDVGHDDLALVVEGLAEVLLPVDLLGLLVVGDDDRLGERFGGGHTGTSSWATRAAGSKTTG
jgi:hypothetical protein